MKKGLKIQTAFDEYILIKQVGSGGNGRVFSAEASNGDAVAIKFVEKNLPASKLKRFKNEIFFCERHNHKNIVEILDRGFVELDGIAYVFYVMPLYKETLRDKMRAKLSPDQAFLTRKLVWNISIRSSGLTALCALCAVPGIAMPSRHAASISAPTAVTRLL